MRPDLEHVPVDLKLRQSLTEVVRIQAEALWQEHAIGVHVNLVGTRGQVVSRLAIEIGVGDYRLAGAAEIPQSIGKSLQLGHPAAAKTVKLENYCSDAIVIARKTQCVLDIS